MDIDEHRKHLENFHDEITKRIHYVCLEFNFTNAEIVGVLECIKLDYLYRRIKIAEAMEDDDEDDNDDTEEINI